MWSILLELLAFVLLVSPLGILTQSWTYIPLASPSISSYYYCSWFIKICCFEVEDMAYDQFYFFSKKIKTSSVLQTHSPSVPATSTPSTTFFLLINIKSRITNHLTSSSIPEGESYLSRLGRICLPTDVHYDFSALFHLQFDWMGDSRHYQQYCFYFFPWTYFNPDALYNIAKFIYLISEQDILKIAGNSYFLFIASIPLGQTITFNNGSFIPAISPSLHYTF